jgi:hypothetical protein
MKQILLTIAIGVFSCMAFTEARADSCPVIVGGNMWFGTNLLNPCQKNVNFNYYNPTSGNKTIRVDIKVSGILVITDCIDASNNVMVIKSYTSAYFTCCNIAQLDVTITPITGND